MSSMTTPLYDTGYWNIKGLGAPLRMLLCWANVPFTATMYDVKMLEGRGLDAKGWFGPKKALKEKNPFVNLPYVAAGDDVLVSQSNACFSFLGRELNMMGQSPNELIMCETLLCEMMDLRNSMTRFAYSDEFANVEADGVALLSNVMGKNGVLQKIELHLANEKLSAPSRSDRFLVGGNCTAPDFHLYEMLDQYLLLSEFVKKGDLLLEFPNLRGECKI